MVEEGKFRADLYYRLNVIPLSLPPLRERRDDVPALAEFFVQRFAVKSNRPVPVLDPEFVAGLQRQAWPGNVRELCEFHAAGVDHDRCQRDWPCASDDELAGLNPAKAPRLIAAASLQAGTSIRELQRHLLETTLDVTGGNRTRAAEMLGVSLRTIRNKIREYGLPPRRYA